MATIYTRKRPHPESADDPFPVRYPPKQYALEDVQAAVTAAVEREQYQLAQEIMDVSGYELCTLCVTVAADDRIELPSGEWVTTCDSCSVPYQ